MAHTNCWALLNPHMPAFQEGRAALPRAQHCKAKKATPLRMKNGTWAVVVVVVANGGALQEWVEETWPSGNKLHDSAPGAGQPDAHYLGLVPPRLRGGRKASAGVRVGY